MFLLQKCPIFQVPIVVHLDHGNSRAEVLEALELVGISAVVLFTSTIGCHLFLLCTVLSLYFIIDLLSIN